MENEIEEEEIVKEEATLRILNNKYMAYNNRWITR